MSGGFSYFKLRVDPVYPKVLKSFRSDITRLSDVLDPMKCEEKYLPYLSQLLGSDLYFEDYQLGSGDSNFIQKKRMFIKELIKFYAIKGVNRSFDVIFEIFSGFAGSGRTFPKMELAWIDTSNPALLSTASSRGPTCWNKLGTLPGDLEFNYVPSGSSNPEDYVPDSRIRLNFSDVAPEDIPSSQDWKFILDRIERTKPFHLIFDKTMTSEIPYDLYIFVRWAQLTHDSIFHPYNDIRHDTWTDPLPGILLSSVADTHWIYHDRYSDEYDNVVVYENSEEVFNRRRSKLNQQKQSAPDALSNPIRYFMYGKIVCVS